MEEDEENSFPVAESTTVTSKQRANSINKHAALSKIPSTRFEKPSFHVAWKHFYDTLPKRIKDRSGTAAMRNRLAHPGELGTPENPAMLWNPWTTSMKDLDAFGLGIGIYFRSVKLTSIMLLICSFIGLIAIFQNRKTNPTQENINEYILLHGNISAMPLKCPLQLIGSTYGATREGLLLSRQGAANLAISLILIIYAVIGWIMETLVAQKIDDDWLTTQDFAVVVTNPHPTIKDPDEYYKYFSQFGEICSITIAKRSSEISLKVAEMKRYEIELSTGNYRRRTQAEQSCFRNMFQCLGMYYTKEFLVEAIAECKKSLMSLSHKDYCPWRVYCIFNTEEAQVDCRKKTELNYLQSFGFSPAPPESIMQDRVLQIIEAPEPSDIMYANSHFLKPFKYFSWACSYAVCMGVLILAFFIIRSLLKAGSLGAALFISLLNNVLPEFAKFVTIMVEIHTNESMLQHAILAKLVIIRCAVSGVMIFIASSYSDTFSLQHINSMMNILLADAIATPVLRFLDVSGWFYRYFLGYFAKSQQDLNVLWVAAEWYLAERYTDVLKTIFVGTFFAVPLPAGLFVTTFAVISNYYVDKYSMLRLWHRPPALDRSLAVLARQYYLVVVWAHINVSRVYFSNWPYGGGWPDATGAAGSPANCSIFFCRFQSDQTSDQHVLVAIYNLLCLASFCTIFGTSIYIGIQNILHAIFCKGGESWVESTLESIKKSLKSLFCSCFENPEVEKTDADTFREIDGADVYLPSVRIDLERTLICVDVDQQSTQLPRKYLRNIVHHEAEAELHHKDHHIFRVLKQEEEPQLLTPALIDCLGIIKYYPSAKEIESSRPSLSNHYHETDTERLADRYSVLGSGRFTPQVVSGRSTPQVVTELSFPQEVEATSISADAGGQSTGRSPRTYRSEDSNKTQISFGISGLSTNVSDANARRLHFENDKLSPKSSSIISEPTNQARPLDKHIRAHQEEEARRTDMNHHSHPTNARQYPGQYFGQPTDVYSHHVPVHTNASQNAIPPPTYEDFLARKHQHEASHASRLGSHTDYQYHPVGLPEPPSIRQIKSFPPNAPAPKSSHSLHRYNSSFAYEDSEKDGDIPPTSARRKGSKKKSSHLNTKQSALKGGSIELPDSVSQKEHQENEEEDSQTFSF